VLTSVEEKLSFLDAVIKKKKPLKDYTKKTQDYHQKQTKLALALALSRIKPLKPQPLPLN
jgi:hypothetical protein